MSDAAIMIVLRVIHIIFGVFWAGAVMVMTWFVLPASEAMGQPGGAFMQRLMFGQRLRVFVSWAMALTILSGLTMYTWLAMEAGGAWARSRMAMTLGVGAVAAIIAGGIGSAVIGRVGEKMAALGATIQASGGPPTDTQKAEMESYQRRMRGTFRIIAVLLIIAIITMAGARYL